MKKKANFLGGLKKKELSGDILSAIKDEVKNNRFTGESKENNMDIKI